MNGYRTVNEGIFELEIKRSKFIAYSRRIENEEQAADILSEIRKKHSDARHVCYAYVADIAGNCARFSDDGEPGGTAGMPILDVIKNNNLKKSLLVVVRYFGGILLGTGGLTRAYGDSASGVVKESGVTFMKECDLYSLTVSYSMYKKISFKLKSIGEITDVLYGTDVRVVLAADKGTDVGSLVTELSGGTVCPEYLNTAFMESESL